VIRARDAPCTACDQLSNAGDARLYYQPGADFMGADNEGTVDGSHPTDVGFLRQARCMQPLLRHVLGA
jgi:GDSL-like lipase/acylhydrolase family protein